MICPSCGATLNDGAQFCTACGAKLTPETPGISQPEPVPMNGPVICPQCGTAKTGIEKFCTNCGAALPSEDAPLKPQEWTAEPAAPSPQPAVMQEWAAAEDQPVPQPNQAQMQDVPRPAPVYAEPSSAVKPAFGAQPANLKEFVSYFGDEKTKKSMKSFSIILYVFAVINLLVAVIGGTLPLDAIILAALGYWYQRTYSNKCAIVLLAYAILSVILSLVMYGQLSGWLIVVLAVVVFTTTQKAQKAYDEYQKSGQAPML